MPRDGRTRDVIVCGGGIAGSVLAGVLARAGVDVLVAEKEPRFRDRIRGEATLPWGVREAKRIGVAQLFDDVGAAPLVGMRYYDGSGSGKTKPWSPNQSDGLPEYGFSHPQVQEASWRWAASQGAEVRRPAKVVDVADDQGPRATVVEGGRERSTKARLVVGADGKMSNARRWTGGESASDPEHHRFGGVAVSGVNTIDRDTDNVAGSPGNWVNWFARGSDTSRLYLSLTRERLKASAAAGSFDALAAYASTFAPEGTLVDVRPEGPIGFFPNSDTWATRIWGNGVVLIGDAAGAPDPTEGHGTSLVFRDVRELSESLLADDDWAAATEEYAVRRARYFEVIHRTDLWRTVLDMDEGEEADRLREAHERAEAEDPTLGGFSLIDAEGPDGLVADEAAADAYFGRG